MEDLEIHSTLIERIRKIKGIREKKPSHFYYKGKNVVHFHTDEGLIFADVGNTRIIVMKEKYDDIMNLIVSYMNTI